MWDIGGDDRIIPFWKNYFQCKDCVIWVTDGYNINRLCFNDKYKCDVIITGFAKDINTRMKSNENYDRYGQCKFIFIPQCIVDICASYIYDPFDVKKERELLHKVMADIQLKEAALLIYVNKQDLGILQQMIKSYKH